MISDMIYDMAVVDSEGAGGLPPPPLWASTFIFYHATFMLCFSLVSQ